MTVRENIVLNVLQALVLGYQKYMISEVKLAVLIRAIEAVRAISEGKTAVWEGYIDISSNTHIKGGLDYDSVTVMADGIEVYKGYVHYDGNGVSDDNTNWEKIYASKDPAHNMRVREKLDLWAESFLLHLDTEPKRSLLIIDKIKE